MPSRFRRKLLLHVADVALAAGLCGVLVVVYYGDFVLTRSNPKKSVVINEEPPIGESQFKVAIQDEPDEGPNVGSTKLFKIEDEPEERIAAFQVRGDEQLHIVPLVLAQFFLQAAHQGSLSASNRTIHINRANPVTSHDVSGPVRFPLDLRLYRRYEELTHWEAFVHTHFPNRPIPLTKKDRARLHKEVDPLL